MNISKCGKTFLNSTYLQEIRLYDEMNKRGLVGGVRGGKKKQWEVEKNII